MPDGTIYTGRPLNMRGGHTTGWNWCAIGVCVVGNFCDHEMPTAQLKACAWLADYIRGLYPSIIMDRHCDHAATACPGTYFPFALIVDPTDEGAPEEADTETVPEWGVDAFDWAKDIGLFKGDGNGIFRPNEPPTRLELAIVLKRFADHYGLK